MAEPKNRAARPSPIERGELFRMALLAEGLTQQAWAERQGISGTTLFKFLRGDFVSERLETLTGAYIAAYAPAIRAALARYAEDQGAVHPAPTARTPRLARAA